MAGIAVFLFRFPDPADEGDDIVRSDEMETYDLRFSARIF